MYIYKYTCVCVSYKSYILCIHVYAVMYLSEQNLLNGSTWLKAKNSCNCTFQRTNLKTNNHSQIIRFWDGAPVPQTGRGVVARRQKHRERHRSQSAAMQNCRKVQRYILATASLMSSLRLPNVFVQWCVSMLGGVRKAWSSQPYWPCKVPNRWLKLPDLDDDRWSEGCCQPNKNLQFPHRMVSLRESLVRSLAPKEIPDCNAGTPWALLHPLPKDCS